MAGVPVVRSEMNFRHRGSRWVAPPSLPAGWPSMARRGGGSPPHLIDVASRVTRAASQP